jgi:hypothetical protein
MHVEFTQSTDDGLTWSAPVKVNDNVDAHGVPTGQFQPEVAAGPNGAVAVAFYDRRLPCPSTPSILPAQFVSTHYPSGVTADGGGPVYYQQQVLATVPRSGFGARFSDHSQANRGTPQVRQVRSGPLCFRSRRAAGRGSGGR